MHISVYRYTTLLQYLSVELKNEWDRHYACLHEMHKRSNFLNYENYCVTIQCSVHIAYRGFQHWALPSGSLQPLAAAASGKWEKAATLSVMTRPAGDPRPAFVLQSGPAWSPSDTWRFGDSDGDGSTGGPSLHLHISFYSPKLRSWMGFTKIKRVWIKNTGEVCQSLGFLMAFTIKFLPFPLYLCLLIGFQFDNRESGGACNGWTEWQIPERRCFDVLAFLTAITAFVFIFLCIMKMTFQYGWSHLTII